MKSISLYSIFLLASLTALVTGSESDTDSDNFYAENSHTKDPKHVKQDFYFELVNGNVPSVKSYIDKYDYLTQQFNVDIFTGLLKCFNGRFSKHEDCMEIVQLLAPSFRDVSESISTPLIHAIIYNNIEIVNILFMMDEIKDLVDKTDQFGRTALMYAAKSGSCYVVQRILNISNESVNLKDKFGKTALHYACEMNRSTKKETISFELPKWLTGEPDIDTENKLQIFKSIYYREAVILEDGPEYKLTSSDRTISEFITSSGGKVRIESSAEELMIKAFAPIAVAHLIKSIVPVDSVASIDPALFNFILANPLILGLNELCYKFQRLLTTDVDLNFVVSLDLGNGFQDYSFNIFFVLLMAFLVEKALGMRFNR